jgi:hypothetical protein
MASWLGLDPNCYTGADCWNYDYSDRWLSIFVIFASTILTIYLTKKYLR